MSEAFVVDSFQMKNFMIFVISGGAVRTDWDLAIFAIKI
jgi:hypothetical protein